MKNKFSRVLVLLICLFVFPILVNADIGMPEIKSYDVIVTNKDGIKLEDSYKKKSIVIPYDTKLTVNMEYYNSEKKTYYGYVEYSGVSGDIDLSNVRIVSTKIDLNEFNKLETPRKVYAINDVELYKGPSKVYGRVEGEKVIPKGSTISYEYYDEVWAYVKYENLEGWMVIYPYGDAIGSDLKTSVVNFAPKGNNTILITNNVTKLKVNPREDEEISVNIPKDTVLKYEYSANSLKSEYFYVDYEGTKGWLLITYYGGPYSAVGLVENKCTTGMVVNDNVYIYSKRGDLSSKTNKKLEKGVEYSIIYSYSVEDASWYYILYNGEKVWVTAEGFANDDSTSILENYGTVYLYKTKEDVDVYEYPSKDAKKIAILKSGTQVDNYYSYTDYTLNYKDEYYYWNYIKTDDVAGWVLNSKIDGSYENRKEICKVADAQEPSPEEEENNEEEKEDKENKTLPPAQMAIIGVGGAVVLALVVVVTLTIINKKKHM